MVLARDVRDAGGGVLLREGTLLTQAIIQRLQEARAVDEVFVAPPPLSEAERASRRQEIRKRAERMFAPHRDDPVMQILERVSVEVLSKRV